MTEYTETIVEYSNTTLSLCLLQASPASAESYKQTENHKLLYKYTYS